MSKTVQTIIVGFVVALIVSIGFGFVDSLQGENHAGGASLGGIGAGVAAAYLFYALSGNRRIASASNADKRAALDRAPPPGKALLFLYREGYIAKLVGLNLTVDGKPVGQLKSPRFTCVVVNPGAHEITCQFGAQIGGPAQTGHCSVDAPADGALAVRITAHIALTKGSGVQLEPQADVAAAKARMAGMPMTPPDLAEV
jgi:hypothetical protein